MECGLDGGERGEGVRDGTTAWGTVGGGGGLDGAEGKRDGVMVAGGGMEDGAGVEVGEEGWGKVKAIKTGKGGAVVVSVGRHGRV